MGGREVPCESADLSVSAIIMPVRSTVPQALALPGSSGRASKRACWFASIEIVCGCEGGRTAGRTRVTVTPIYLMVYIKQLKVRPVKGGFSSFLPFAYISNCLPVAPYVPCKVELAAMMGCWATQGDFASLTKCAEAAQTLHQCMRTAVRV
jgi:hypothetical protein